VAHRRGRLDRGIQGEFNAEDYAYQLEHGVRQPADEDEDTPPVRRGRPPNAAKQRASSEDDGDIE
jgi:hypothetical protein